MKLSLALAAVKKGNEFHGALEVVYLSGAAVQNGQAVPASFTKTALERSPLIALSFVWVQCGHQIVRQAKGEGTVA